MSQLRALWSVAFHSLRYRLGGVMLTCFAVALSVFVLLGVEHVRQEARASFSSTVSGVDLIVGARTTEVNLLLLSIFRIGNATTNVTWDSVETITERAEVDWVVPMSLGDSHGGYRVVGTTAEFFSRYKYGPSRALEFSAGQAFEGLDEVVLGATVAASLGYALGDSLVLSHGVADTSFTHHEEDPLTVVGVLERSGTPVDNALFASLEAIDAIHTDGDHAHEAEDQAHEDEDHEDEDRAHEDEDHAHEEEDHAHEEEDHAHEDEDHDDEDEDHAHEDEDHDDEDEDHAHASDEHAHDAPIDSVTALLVGVDLPLATLVLQRWINEYPEEALLAILPGVALAQLWELVGAVEDTLRGISALVLISSLFGLNAMLLVSMRERRREIEILRSIGAPSLFVLGLLVIESLVIVSIGVIVAIVGLLLTIALVNGPLASEVGLTLSWQIFGPSSGIVLGLIFASAILLSLVPAYQAYRMSRLDKGNAASGS